MLDFNNEASVTELLQFDSELLQIMLKFIYLGQVEIDSDRLMDLLELAN